MPGVGSIVTHLCANVNRAGKIFDFFGKALDKTGGFRYNDEA
jgi:hypothetical protein